MAKKSNKQTYDYVVSTIWFDYLYNYKLCNFKISNIKSF
jgi:hypothetical protein